MSCSRSLNDATLNAGYELHYLFEKDIKLIKSIESIVDFYQQQLRGRIYF